MSYIIRPDKTFGPWLDFPHKGLGKDAMIVCALTPTHLQPVRVMLSHQLYQRTALDLMTAHEAQELHVLHYSHDDLVRVLRKEIEFAP